MIYLIDDNKYGQMSENYKLDFTKVLLTYHGIINWFQTISENDIDHIISDAACILIHDSLEEKEVKERIVAMAKKSKIPYCLFSNGFTATIFDGDSIKEIKKDRLYNNLIVFMNYFKSEGSIDLRLLSLGKNYEVEKAAIIQDRLSNGVLFKGRNNFNFEVAFPSGSQDRKDLRELFYMSEVFSNKDVYEDAYNNFEDKYSDIKTTAKIMEDAISKLTNKINSRYE